MTALAAAIATTIPREKDGPRSGSRFEFQIHVSLAKVLEAHKAGGDYRAIFDYFDDLAILDSSNDPTAIHFYQIKGKEPGRWTIANLTKEEAAPPRTIVGKMYHNAADFGIYSISAVFLTNASFSFGLATGGKTTPDHISVTLHELTSDERKKVADALDLDFEPPRSPKEEVILRFERTEVPVKGYVTMLKGHVAELFDDSPGIQTGPLYRLLIEKIRAKSHDTSVCNGTDEVYAKKSLCREEISDAIAAATETRGILQNWSVVDADLREGGLNARRRIQLNGAAIEFISSRSKLRANAVALHSAIEDALGQVGNELGTCSGLVEAMAVVKAKASEQNIEGDDLAIDAAILVEVYGVFNAE